MFYLATYKTAAVWMWKLQHCGHKSMMTAGFAIHVINLITELFYKNMCVQKREERANTRQKCKNKTQEKHSDNKINAKITDGQMRI